MWNNYANIVLINENISKFNASSGLFYKHGLTLIPARMSKHMPGKMWGEITYPFLNFNGSTVEV